MSYAGSVLDMIKRINQNNALRKSRRDRHQKVTGDTSYRRHEVETFDFPKNIPEEELNKIKTAIRKKAEKSRNREYLFFAISLIILVYIIVRYTYLN